MPQAYTIMISEEQRKALLKVLLGSCTEPALKYWPEMLEELPEIEKQYPGVLHGFCL